MKFNRMLVIACVLSANLALTGCSIRQTASSVGTSPIAMQNKMFGDKTFKTDSGETLSVNMLKQKYLAETGRTLPEPETLDCSWEAKCYFNAWAKMYDSLMIPYRRDKQRKIDAEAARKRCETDPECVKQGAIADASSELNQAYAIMIGQNQYLQAHYDGFIRTVCRDAGSAQRRGVTETQISEALNTAPGIAPMDRVYIKKVAESCWKLSKLGVKDGGSVIRYGY